MLAGNPSIAPHAVRWPRATASEVPPETSESLRPTVVVTVGREKCPAPGSSSRSAGWSPQR